MWLIARRGSTHEKFLIFKTASEMRSKSRGEWVPINPSTSIPKSGRAAEKRIQISVDFLPEYRCKSK